MMLILVAFLTALCCGSSGQPDHIVLDANSESTLKTPQCEDDPAPPDYSVPDKSEWYPTYHLAPPYGWMNDPNGLIYFGGRYHAFYQHNPSAPVWGDIHWGHAWSRDLVEWHHLPPALAPSIDEDRDGCFSGSAVDDNGTLTLLYTGNIFLDGDNLHQTTCLATSPDGVTFAKHGKVLDPPAGVQHFRDPKAWRGRDGHWYVAMGTRDGDRGEAHLYTSQDLREWEFVQVIARANDNQGYMWECPDFFPLGDKYVLALSPQGIRATGYQYRNLYQSGYMVGTWQPGDPFAIERNFTEMDSGHDFYAPQSFVAPEGRRIVIGWMDMWQSPMPESGQGWSGMLSLPREISLAPDGTLRAQPVREVENFRCSAAYRTRTVLQSESLRLECDARALEIVTVWNLADSDAERYGLRLGDSNGSADGLFLFVDTQAGRLTLDRRYPQFGLSGYRSVALPKTGELTLRLFLDSSSAEVFVDSGREVLSSRIYPGPGQRFLSLFADNGKAVLESSERWNICAHYGQ